MNRRIQCLLAALSMLLLSGAAIPNRQAGPKASVDELMDQLSAVRRFRQVAVSPDGRSVGWVVTENAASSNSAIYVADPGSPAKPRRITAAHDNAACTEKSMAWSPGGSRIAFLSDHAEPGQLELYVARSAGGAARKLTGVTGFLADPRWSPDGKTVAVLFTENAPRAGGPLQPATRDVGVIEDEVFEQRLTLVDVESGRVRQLSPPDLYVYEYDWSPDGRKLAAIAAPGSGDNNWYIAGLYAFDAGSGETRLLVKAPMQIAVPRWSPDGQTIAFVGGLMSDETVTGGDIYTLPVAGGEPANITPDMKASASWLAWQPASDRILFSAHEDGGVAIGTVSAKGGPITTLWSAPESIAAEPGIYGPSISVSRDRTYCAAIRESSRRPPEVWGGPIGSWNQLTQVNGTKPVSWGEARSLHWTCDGMGVQGWLLFPRNYDASRRYPMVVSVHGGPAGAETPSWPDTFFDMTLLANEGYFVFSPNPRGSFGHGEAFTRANVKDFGYGDLRDILAGVDEVVRTFPVDDHRIGITGWSYGGYMTMWAVTQTHRFAAAVAGAGVANWQSYYGENGIDQWLIPYFGASVYDDPAVYARSSPINFIKNAKTPTLILVGERDIECPTPQSYEFWHALKTLGVKVRFVVYPGEGHAIADPDHRRDIMRRTVAWFDEHLKQHTAR